MHRLFSKSIVFLALLVALQPQGAAAHPATMDMEAFQAHAPMAEVLLLGTFHFKDAGLDGYKPEVDIDILSEVRQREVAEVVDALATRFRPTKIAVEARGDWARRIVDKEYPAHLQGGFELPANEVYQVGFRLAKQLEHATLYPVDAAGRRYENLPTDGDGMAYARALGQEGLLQGPWSERYAALHRHEDLAKAGRPLRDTLLAMNTEERLLAGHGQYLLGGIALGTGDGYPGADHVSGWWYNRNLRIFANIRRIAEPGDRILVLIGAGHVPIIRHAVQASPEFRLVEVSDALGRVD